MLRIKRKIELPIRRQKEGKESSPNRVISITERPKIRRGRVNGRIIRERRRPPPWVLRVSRLPKIPRALRAGNPMRRVKSSENVSPRERAKREEKTKLMKAKGRPMKRYSAMTLDKR
ncbi:hypothetical protein QM565_22365 [Geitlerinema splendidum]|jgi:hypothetical protein|nr:hypothetical protein [Geitlerinema splendidum]